MDVEKDIWIRKLEKGWKSKSKKIDKLRSEREGDKERKEKVSKKERK